MECTAERSNSGRGLRLLLEPPGDLTERLRLVEDPFFGGLRAKDVEIGEDDLEDGRSLSESFVRERNTDAEEVEASRS